MTRYPAVENYLQIKANLHLLKRIGCLGRIEEDKFAFYLIIQQKLAYFPHWTYYVHLKLFLPFVLLLLHYVKPWLRHQQCTSFVYNFPKKVCNYFFFEIKCYLGYFYSPVFLWNWKKASFIIFLIAFDTKFFEARAII